MSEEERDQDPLDGDIKISAVSIRCPQFSENNPSNWFRVLEAQFTLKGITVSSTQYLHALSNLPTDVLDNLPETVIETHNYANLKSAVIGFYTKTKSELFERLISATPVVGRPSAYLRSLQQVASKVGGNEDLVKHKFMQSLPPIIATALASQRSLTIDEIGTMADELSPLVAASNQVNYVDNSQASYRQARSSSHQHRSSSPHQHRTPHHQRSSDELNIPLGVRPYGQNQRPKVCRAHLYFADKARTCKPWCRFPNKKNCYIQQSSRPASPARSSNSEN